MFVCLYVCKVCLIWGRDYAIQDGNYINNELLGKTLDTKFNFKFVCYFGF